MNLLFAIQLALLLSSATAHTIFQVSHWATTGHPTKLNQRLPGTPCKWCLPRPIKWYPSTLQPECKRYTALHKPISDFLGAQYVSDVNSKDIICNGGKIPFYQPISNKIISVPAGAELTAEWHASLILNDPNWINADPLPDNHRGPILVYLYVKFLLTQSLVAIF